MQNKKPVYGYTEDRLTPHAPDWGEVLFGDPAVSFTRSVAVRPGVTPGLLLSENLICCATIAAYKP